MPTPPYDTVITAINAARVRLNDDITTLAPVSGKLLDNTQPFTQQVVNNGWRKLQEYLRDLGYSGLRGELEFSNVPACTFSDCSSQVSIGYNGYFDGTTTQVAPVLPQNFVQPFKLWERVYQVAPNTAPFLEMDYILNGLPAVAKSLWNRQWEWRGDTIYMIGATGATDIRIRYSWTYADFVDVGSTAGPNQTANTPWYNQPIPIQRAMDALADFCCRELEIARGAADAAMAFQISAQANARLILNRDTAQPKSILKSSEYQKMADPYTPNNGPQTEPINRKMA